MIEVSRTIRYWGGVKTVTTKYGDGCTTRFTSEQTWWDRVVCFFQNKK